MLRVSDPLSACVFKISLSSGGRIGGTATASLFFHEGRTFIVTARHNLTGKNAFTGLPLGQDSSFKPRELRLKLPFESKSDLGEQAFGSNACCIALYDSDIRPIWRVHNTEDCRFDCAVIDLNELCQRKLISDEGSTATEGTFLEDTALLASSNDFQVVASGMSARLATIANHVSLGFDIRVGDDVLILGFPESIDVGGGLPLWKRATISSEPSANIEGMPFMFVDSATRKGMSGAPVVARQTRGSAQLPRGTLSLLHGEVNAFVGIYTSRDAGTDEFAAQLGRVWRREHLLAIMSDGRREQPQ